MNDFLHLVVNECDGKDCLHNGTCQDLDGLSTWRCNCVSGFTGILCETGKLHLNSPLSLAFTDWKKNENTNITTYINIKSEKSILIHFYDKMLSLIPDVKLSSSNIRTIFLIFWLWHKIKKIYRNSFAKYFADIGSSTGKNRLLKMCLHETHL